MYLSNRGTNGNGLGRNRRGNVKMLRFWRDGGQRDTASINIREKSEHDPCRFTGLEYIIRYVRFLIRGISRTTRRYLDA